MCLVNDTSKYSRYSPCKNKALFFTYYPFGFIYRHADGQPIYSRPERPASVLSTPPNGDVAYRNVSPLNAAAPAAAAAAAAAAATGPQRDSATPSDASTPILRMRRTADHLGA
jgi:hypothetical protein